MAFGIALSEVRQPMADTLFPWVGSKLKLVPFIIPMVPPSSDTVVDAFGEDVETKAFGDDAFTVETETAASPVFYRWVFGYGGKIRITEPENVKREYAEMVKSAFGNTCGRCGA